MSDTKSDSRSDIRNDAQSAHTWVAFGPAGALGSIHAMNDGYAFRLTGEEIRRTSYPTLEIAKRAMVATLPTGSDWPEFREH